jgi:hypothetical protein
MSLSPTLHHDDILVVFDGPRRLLWSSPAPGTYAPAALWPDPVQVADVLDHLGAGGNVLVLLDQEDITIPLYADEAASIPPELRRSMTVTTDGVLTEVHLTALDWLPEHFRQRGLRFLRYTEQLLARRHDLLLPPLLVEAPGPEPVNLRFARLRTPRPFDESHIDALGDWLFAGTTATSKDPLPALEVSP